LDDDLDRKVLVTWDNEKPGTLGARLLVLGARHGDALEAADGRAFTDDLRSRAALPVGLFSKELVRLPEEVLVPREPARS
jgi:hypothetical protein